MADKSLVKGAAVLGATKGPVGADMNLGFKGVDNTQLLAAKKANEQKVAATTAAVNSHMAKLSSNVDLTGYTNEEQKGFKNFLNAQRSAYAYSANEAARINDASDPDYQFYVDSMNAINNSIVNLKAQSTAYQEGKIDFAQSNEADLWSAGNDPESNSNAQLIFGLGETRAPMKIDNNGNLGFKVNDNTIMYKDYEAPFMKDYKTAKYIADTSNTLYNAHSKLSDAKRHQIRLGLEQELAKPESLKSIISADFTLDGLDFSNITFNPEDIAGTRKQLIDAIMQGYEDVALVGYNKKQNKGKGSSVNPGNAVKNADGTQTYVSPDKTGPLAGDVDSYTDNKQGDYAMRIDQSTDYAINNMQEATIKVKGPDGKDVERKIRRGIGMPFKIKGMEFTPVYQVFKVQGKSGTNKTKAVYIYQQGGEAKEFSYDEMMQYAKGA